jgi:hypothetical protein
LFCLHEADFPISENNKRTVSVAAGIGLYQTLSSKIKVEYDDGSTKNETMEVTAVRLILSLMRSGRKNSGLQWGVGVSPYLFKGWIRSGVPKSAVKDWDLIW